MSQAFPRLSARDRRTLIRALEQGDLLAPYSELSLTRYVGKATVPSLATHLARLHALGLTPALLREFLEILDEEPEPVEAKLVWTGPEDQGNETRDTGVVARELFTESESDVLVAGFAIHQGRSVFEVLAQRMDALPNLRVRFFLNIERPYGDSTVEEQLVYAFASKFRTEQWPGIRLPEVYFDPRSLLPRDKGVGRAVLHAKCIVADRRRALVTSANLTEAGQERNIELGLLIADPALVGTLTKQFDALVERGSLRRVPGL